MTERLLTLYLLLAAATLSGCGGVTFVASPNMGSMMQQFPFRAQQPIARQLRYSYIDVSVIDGKQGEPRLSADPATRAQGSNAPPPAAVFASATSGPTLRYSDELSRQADEMARKGVAPRRVGEVREHAVAQAQAEVSLERAQANLSAAYAVAGLLQSLEQTVQHWADTSADLLGNWIETNTNVIGRQAPEGSVLQLDFFQAFTGRSFNLETRKDILVHATLRDGHGRTFQSRQAVQLYTFSKDRGAEVPADAFAFEPGWASPAKQPLLKELVADSPYTAHLAITASAALADLYRQLEGK